MTSASVPPTGLTGTVAVPSPKRRWPTFVAIGAVAVLVGVAVGYFAGAPARNDLQSQRDDALTQVQSLTDQLDATEADLATTQADLATATSDLATTQADLTSSQSEVTSLTQERDQLSDVVTAAALMTRARAYFDLNFGSEYLAFLAQGGADLSSYDALLASLGESSTLTEWVDGPLGFWAAQAAVLAIDDAQLTDAWNAWMSTEVGTAADEVAYWAIAARLDQLLVDATVSAG